MYRKSEKYCWVMRYQFMFIFCGLVLEFNICLVPAFSLLGKMASMTFKTFIYNSNNGQVVHLRIWIRFVVHSTHGVQYKFWLVCHLYFIWFQQATFEAFVGIRDEIATSQVKLFGDQLQVISLNFFKKILSFALHQLWSLFRIWRKTFQWTIFSNQTVYRLLQFAWSISSTILGYVTNLTLTTKNRLFVNKENQTFLFLLYGLW